MEQSHATLPLRRSAVPAAYNGPNPGPYPVVDVLDYLHLSGVDLKPPIRFPFGAPEAEFTLSYKEVWPSGERFASVHVTFHRCPDQNLAHNCVIQGMPDLPK
jgi:hypothetical protein